MVNLLSVWIEPDRPLLLVLGAFGPPPVSPATDLVLAYGMLHNRVCGIRDLVFDTVEEYTLLLTSDS